MIKSLKMVGELEVGELKKVPVDIKKLSDVVDKDIIKKIVYDQLVTKVKTDQWSMVKTERFLVKQS